MTDATRNPSVPSCRDTYGSCLGTSSDFLETRLAPWLRGATSPVWTRHGEDGHGQTSPVSMLSAGLASAGLRSLRNLATLEHLWAIAADRLAWRELCQDAHKVK